MMKHRDKMNVLESPKSDETELVPISSNKINIQGRNFTKKMVIYGFFFNSDPKKLFSKKSKQKLSLPEAIFKMVFNEVTSVNLLNDICIFYARYHGQARPEFNFLSR